MSSKDTIVLDILEPALEYVQKCTVDSRVIDGTFPSLSCPVCGILLCMFPCAETLASKNKKCPSCKRSEMNVLTEIVRNTKYRLKLEELKAAGMVSDAIYDKLRLEYDRKNREAVGRVYPTGSEKTHDVISIECPTCGKPADYVPRYERWYCYNCGRYLAEHSRG